MFFEFLNLEKINGLYLFFAFGSMAEISPFCHIKNLIEKVIAIFWLGAKIENSKSNSDRADFKSYIPIMINDHRIDF